MEIIKWLVVGFHLKPINIDKKICIEVRCTVGTELDILIIIYIIKKEKYKWTPVISTKRMTTRPKSLKNNPNRSKLRPYKKENQVDRSPTNQHRMTCFKTGA